MQIQFMWMLQIVSLTNQQELRIRKRRERLFGGEFIEVFAEEARKLDGMVYRQPFPGPGLGVRCPGAITRDRLEAVRESDAILREEFEKNGFEGKIWQYFTVVLATNGNIL